MKKHTKKHRNPLAVNSVCYRVLRFMRRALTKQHTRWTPFEGVPVSVFLADLRKRETAG